MVEKIGLTSRAVTTKPQNKAEQSNSSESIFTVGSEMTAEEIKKAKIDLAVKKAELEKLEKMTYQDYQTKRNVPSVIGGGVAGLLGGAALGAKIGTASLNPIGIFAGALIGGLVGLIAGSFGGAAINDALTPEEKEFEAKKAQDISVLQQEISDLEKILSSVEN